ncbi:hypothetical protein CEXT_717271 [Caerostris extrusa]|uniref:Secreted protein n=1 Tax=Caerostris extrusa TaxID=172846 RepID=A0AAV4Y8G8_CAEEX|nr:hypothetical protein CEXT_717271 [Caerostris extrusa]
MPFSVELWRQLGTSLSLAFSWFFLSSQPMRAVRQASSLSLRNSGFSLDDKLSCCRTLNQSETISPVTKVSDWLVIYDK